MAGRLTGIVLSPEALAADVGVRSEHDPELSGAGCGRGGLGAAVAPQQGRGRRAAPANLHVVIDATARPSGRL